MRAVIDRRWLRWNDGVRQTTALASVQRCPLSRLLNWGQSLCRRCCVPVRDLQFHIVSYPTCSSVSFAICRIGLPGLQPVVGSFRRGAEYPQPDLATGVHLSVHDLLYYIVSQPVNSSRATWPGAYFASAPSPARYFLRRYTQPHTTCKSSRSGRNTYLTSFSRERGHIMRVRVIKPRDKTAS